MEANKIPKVALDSKAKLVLLGVVVLVVISFSPSLYFGKKYQETLNLLKNPTEVAKREVDSILVEVGKKIELPSESPTIATVSDKEKLKDQPFFAKAENGDKVLIYPEARKAILYRPSVDKIIEVSTLTIGGGETKDKVEVVAAKVAILNGTTRDGVATKMRDQLKGSMSTLEINSISNATKSDYAETLVVILNSSKEAEAKLMAEALKAKISALPAGEAKPDADVLIIVGANYTPAP